MKLQSSDHEEDDYATNENPGSADIIVAVGCMHTITFLGIGARRSGVADTLVTNKSQDMNAPDMKIGPSRKQTPVKFWLPEWTTFA